MSRTSRRSLAVTGFLVAAVATVTACGPPRPSATPLPVLAIGDSVMALAVPALDARGITTEARASRQFKAAIPIVHLYAAEHRLPSIVVVHLGTNGPVSAATCDALVATVGSRRLILMNVNLHGLRSWEAANNVVIAACARRHHDALIDWKAASAGKPWFAPDRIHLNAVGARAYASLVRAAV
jgi:hypothetical protein